MSNNRQSHTKQKGPPLAAPSPLREKLLLSSALLLARSALLHAGAALRGRTGNRVMLRRPMTASRRARRWGIPPDFAIRAESAGSRGQRWPVQDRHHCGIRKIGADI